MDRERMVGKGVMREDLYDYLATDTIQHVGEKGLATTIEAPRKSGYPAYVMRMSH